MISSSLDNRRSPMRFIVNEPVHFHPELFCHDGQGRKQHRIEMRVPVIVQRIQQVFNMHAGFRFSLDVQTASEKEGIGVFLAGGQLPEINKITADGHIRLALKRRLQARVVDPEIKPGLGIPDMYADGLALDLTETQRQCLAPHKMVKTPGQDGGMECVRQDTQWQL